MGVLVVGCTSPREEPEPTSTGIVLVEAVPGCAEARHVSLPRVTLTRDGTPEVEARVGRPTRIETGSWKVYVRARRPTEGLPFYEVSSEPVRIRAGGRATLRARIDGHVCQQ